MSCTRASAHYCDTSALSAKLLVCLVGMFVLVSAAGALLRLYARCRWRNSPLSQLRASFVDVEEARGETAESLQTVGLNKLFLDSLPSFVFSKKMAVEAVECSVCLCEFQENEKGRLLPKCNHRFHTGCIDMWFHTHSTCPLCRTCVGVEESLYFYPYVDEEMGFSASPTFCAGNGNSLASTTSAELDQSLFLKAFAFDKHKMTAFLQQQGSRFSPWRQQQQSAGPASAPASRKSVQLPVNVLFCGGETQMTSHVGSNSSAMKAGHLAMDLPGIGLSPSPSWTSTPSMDPPAVKNSPLSHLNTIKRILNTKEHRFGAAPVASNFTDCEQGIEAL
ncbi:hypothetical protein O6H91_13G062200 [Diphasiastrum complanatum]|uniref:Uncharacterized protein n=1 Tax=Diphasiastrum complanatum TaxID=34168 RepID=A0ACC2BVE2_DIPCM|nr:hypothetical protein O6H91_13G062200 [Diphasiastrum complanatum]